MFEKAVNFKYLRPEIKKNKGGRHGNKPTHYYYFFFMMLLTLIVYNICVFIFSNGIR